MTVKGDSNGLIDLVRILDAENYNFQNGATIVFDVSNDTTVPDGTMAVVTDGVNVNISDDDNNARVEVRDRDNSDGNDAIDFFTDDPANFIAELDENANLEVVDSFGIDCGGNNNHHNNRQDRRNAIRDLVDQYRDNNDLSNAENELSTLDNEISTLDSDLSGEDTLGNGDNSGVSATADENGAEASTPGASASANGDEDTLGPVSGPQGNVVDEVPTSGPLPNTGGVPPIAAGTVLALVLFGAGLLAVRLVMIWRARRA